MSYSAKWKGFCFGHTRLMLIHMSSPPFPGTSVLYLHLPVQQSTRVSCHYLHIELRHSAFKLMSDSKPQIQEAQWTPNRIKVKTNKQTKQIPGHVIFKLYNMKDKEKLLKEAKGEKNTLPLKEHKYELYLTYQKQCKQEESTAKYLKCWKKKLTNLVFCTQWNYSSKVKEK